MSIERGERRQVRGGKWQEASRRKWRPKAKQDSHRNIHGGRRPTESFFFTEISLDMGAWEMFDVFTQYGEVDEVEIPSKKDVRGRRYGFLRFFGVLDPVMLAVKLDIIFLGRKKIHMNTPRFFREKTIKHNNIGRREQKDYVKQQDMNNMGCNRYFGPTAKGEGLSYAQVVGEVGKNPLFTTRNLPYNNGHLQ